MKEGLFNITCLSDSPEGFTVTTGESLRRRNPGTPLALADDQKVLLSKAMQGEVQYMV